VFIRSFKDSDGDGIGDIRGLIERLDYLNDGDPASTDDLGITGLWLMPVAESPSYHGYDVVDYLTVEWDYGTNQDFEDLVDAAHERGIAVIVDLVMNHTSRDHPWFREATREGTAHDPWYVWSDTRPAVSGPGGRPVWHQAGDRWFYGYFWDGMPDLNLANPAVAKELDRISSFWLADMGVDGFRLDAARHLIEDGDQLENTQATLDWLTGYRDRVKAVDEDALVLGEVWDSTLTAAGYVREGALDLAFDFDLASAFLTSIRARDADTIRAVQSQVSEAYPAGGYAAFLTNHDQDRSWDELGRDLDSAKLAASLLLTNPGTPFVYYGEELGLRGRKPDERIRTPLPWSADGAGAGFTTGTPWQPLAENAAQANVAGQENDPESLLSHYRTLIGLRNEHEALRTGELVPVEVEARGLYAYLRATADESVLVLVNLRPDPVTEYGLSLPEGSLCGSLTAEGLLGPEDVTAPSVSAAGGVTDWRPLPELQGRSTLIVRLTP
jgi:glycosidase